MSDLISREQAIDVATSATMEWDGMYVQDLNVRIREAIEQLPPVNNSEMPNSSDAISRQSVIDMLDETKRIARQNIDGAVLITFEKVLQSLVNITNALPPIQPKRGRWIEDKGQQTLMKNFIERGEVWRVCSECGAGHMIGHKYESDKAYHETHHNFCPNCGADMRQIEE